MTTVSEKAQCVNWYAVSGKSAVTVQRIYRRVYRKTPSSINSIRNWCEQFFKTGSVLDSKLPGRPSTSDDTEHCQSSRIFHASF
jgi:transposase